MFKNKKHKIHLVKLLIDIFQDSFLGDKLLFKGGTAAYLFYKLDRFSTDLDFDILFNPKDNKDFVEEIQKRVNAIVKKNGYIINDKKDKFNTLYWEISYAQGERNIKIEISKRFNEKLIPKNKLHNFYGVSINVIALEYLIAQKLITTLYRKKQTNRDLYDSHFYLDSQNATNINYDYIEKYTGLKRKKFLKELLKLVQSKSNHKILDGLGEVLEEEKKSLIKRDLLKNLAILIKIQIENL
jgi:predicted nucleotidyltransferase component of viral defense system